MKFWLLIFLGSFLVLCFGIEDRKQARTLEDVSWEWYKNQIFEIRQGIANIATHPDQIEFICQLYQGFKNTKIQKPKDCQNIKLKILNNDGCISEKIFEKITGWKYSCLVGKEEIIFFFPEDKSFVFGVEQRDDPVKKSEDSDIPGPGAPAPR